MQYDIKDQKLYKEFIHLSKEFLLELINKDYNYEEIKMINESHSPENKKRGELLKRTLIEASKSKSKNKKNDNE